MMDQNLPDNLHQHQQRPQSPLPQLVIQPPDEDDDDFEDEEEPRERGDPFGRYFSLMNVIFLISSLLISGGVIFEPQLIAWFWKVYAPEETQDYLVNVKNCKIPNLYDGRSALPFIWDLDVSRNGNLEHVDFNCETVEQFSEVEDEQLYLLTKLKKRKCCFRNITRPENMESDMYRVSNNCLEFVDNGTDVSGSEFLLVQCIHTRNKSVDFNTHALLPSKPSVVDKILYWSSKYNKDDDVPFSVAVIVIASTSRSHAFRSLPETMEYLEGPEARFTTISGYQSMEENTPSVALAYSNILPLIAGITDSSKLRWTTRWDNYSMLWSKFSEQKYVTMFMDDSKKMLRTNHGNFNLNGKHKAFRKQPTDYYLKPFLEAHSEATDALFMNNRAVPKRYCVGKRTITSYLLQHLIRYHKKFEMIPTFSFSYLTWPQQQFGLEALSKMDRTYLNFFKDFLAMPHVSEKTAVIVMSDQGSINHPYFKTEHGSIEKMNPLLMIKLPQALVDKHPKYVENLKVNSHRIVSPIDVHRTISVFPKIFTERKDLDPEFSDDGIKTGIVTSPSNQEKILGKNLFSSEIPYDRKCEDAYIPAQMCLCNRSVPHNFNGRIIMSEDGMPERYWHYVSLPK